MTTEPKADVETAIGKTPGSKTIVVHAELYQTLVWGKQTMMTEHYLARETAKTAFSANLSDPKQPESLFIPTFADVIVENINRANHFAQLMSRIIREHPELKPIIEEVAKQDPEHYKLVEPMLRVLGKRKSRA